MRLTKRLAAVGSAVIVTATFGLAAAPAAHAVAPPPLDPTHWSISCDSLVGTIKFATGLTLAPATSNNTITVKATTSGCNVPQTNDATTGDPVNCVQPGVKTVRQGGVTTAGSTAISFASGTGNGSFTDGAGPGDVGAAITAPGIPSHDTIASVQDAQHATLAAAATVSGTGVAFTITTTPVPNQPCVNIAPAKVSGTLIALAGHNQSPPVADSSGCLGLQGLSSGISGSAVGVYKNQSKGLDNLTPLPKLLDPQGNANVTFTVSQTFGGTYSSDSWGASYGEFQIGTQFGTTVSPRNGIDAFEGPGTSHGSNDAFDGTTGQSEGAILVQCLGKGVKLLNFGIGRVNFG